MKLYISFFTIAISLLAFSCKSTKQKVNLNKDEIRFSLEKGACFGKCPIYSLTINQAGYATFEGKAHTDKLGIYGKQISDDHFKSLEKTFASSNFESFPEKFASQIADLPTNTIGYHNGEVYREISGKEDRPEPVLQMQFSLEKIADSGNWKLLQSAKEIDFTKKPEVVNIYNEVIIEPIPGTLIAKWIESMDKYGVRLMKKIAPTLNLYLITYDTNAVTHDDFLNALKRDENIKSAEFNKKTSKRGR